MQRTESENQLIYHFSPLLPGEPRVREMDVQKARENRPRERVGETHLLTQHTHAHMHMHARTHTYKRTYMHTDPSGMAGGRESEEAEIGWSEGPPHQLS